MEIGKEKENCDMGQDRTGRTKWVKVKQAERGTETGKEKEGREKLINISKRGKILLPNSSSKARNNIQTSFQRHPLWH